MKLERAIFRFSILTFLSISCVDRVNLEGIKIIDNFPIVIDGFISNQGGPYFITVTKSFDIESTYSPREVYDVRKMTISDDKGQSENLEKISDGIYQINDLKGVVGNIYKLRVEFFDGRIYESIPDTLNANGKIDSIYYSYNDGEQSVNGLNEPRYVINTNSTGTIENKEYMWSLKTTFKTLTHPELYVNKACYFFEGKCNYVPPCSGYRNVGTQSVPIIVQLLPCECCTCWYDIFNTSPILSDDFITKGHFNGIEVGSFPVNGWTFMEKVRVEVTMRSLGRGTFKYFRSIRDQKRAINSLFQPVTGKIPLNFVQLAGREQDVYGIFYAAGVDSRSFYIHRNQVPHNDMLPTSKNYTDLGIGFVSCLDLFPNSTSSKPTFWED